jgi:hypothetical protein
MKRSALKRAPALAVACVAVLTLAGAAGATFNTSRLVSVGTNGTDTGVQFEGVSSDGSKVFFSTTDQISGAVGGPDTDARKDIYMRSGGVTTLVTPNTNLAVNYMGASADGSIVFFNTTEGLDPGDADGLRDIYAVSSGTYTLVTPGTTNATLPAFLGNSADGSKVFFSAADQLDPADTDTLVDLYQRSGGTTTLLTHGTTVAPAFEAASADGSQVFFSTTEAIAGTGDADTNRDIYRRSGGTTTLVTPSTTQAVTFGGISADGATLFFTTNQKLDAVNDTDSVKDVYSGTSAPYTLVTPGTVVATDYAGNSADGSHVFFTTAENLAGDSDGLTDIFDRSGGTYTLVSGVSAVVPTFVGNSADGTKVYFTTTESLEAHDIDGGLADVYEVTNGGPPLLVSKQGAGASPPFAAVTWGGKTPDGSRVYFDTAEKLTGDDGDTNQDVYEALTDSVPPTVTPSQTPDGSNGWFKTAPATVHGLHGNRRRRELDADGDPAPEARYDRADDHALAEPERRKRLVHDGAGAAARAGGGRPGDRLGQLHRRRLSGLARARGHDGDDDRPIRRDLGRRRPHGRLHRLRRGR